MQKDITNRDIWRKPAFGMSSFPSGWLTSVRQCCEAQEGMGDMPGKSQKSKTAISELGEPGESGFEQ